MQLKKELTDFLSSDKKELLVHTDAQNARYTKIEFDHGYTLLLKSIFHNLKNRFEIFDTGAICLVDKDNEIIYISPHQSYRFNIATELNTEKDFYEIREQTAQLHKEIVDAVYDIVIKKLPLLDESILKKSDIKGYMPIAIKDYKNKKENKFPVEKRHIDLNPETVIDYLENPDNLENDILDVLSDRTISEYEQYIIKKKCLELYMGEMEKNPDSKKLSDIIDIINGEKQSYSINYHTPRGAIKKQSFKKNVSAMDSLNKTVLDYQILNRIPIELIDTITWRNDVLYDAKNYPEPKTDKKEIAVKYGLLNSMYDLSTVQLSDPYIMSEIVFANPDKMIDIDESLKNSHEFIMSLINKCDTKSQRRQFLVDCDPGIYIWQLDSKISKELFFQLASEKLCENKDFLIDYMNNANSTKYNYHIGFNTSDYAKKLERVILKNADDYEFCQVLVDKIGANKDILDLVPTHFIERPEMLKILKDHNDQSNAYRKITKIENLKYVYNERQIRDHLYDLNDEVLYNKKFVLDNLTSRALDNDRILYLYRNDDEVYNKIIESINSSSGAFNFIKYMGYDKETVKKFELCSKNINFMATLDDPDKKIFIDGELSDIESINMDKANRSITITTANCIITAGEFKTTFASRENINQEIKINELYCSREVDEYIKSKIAEVIKNEYKLRSRIYGSVLYEALEKNSKEEDIER